MCIVTAGDFQRNLGQYQDRALVEPVIITRNGRERTVLISADEYRRLKRRDREVLALDDFTDKDIAALEKARAPSEAAAFNHEVK
jgi:prevent-host-death family protein